MPEYRVLVGNRPLPCPAHLLKKGLLTWHFLIIGRFAPRVRSAFWGVDATGGRGPAMGRGGHPLTYGFSRDIFHIGKIIER